MQPTLKPETISANHNSIEWSYAGEIHRTCGGCGAVWREGMEDEKCWEILKPRTVRANRDATDL